MKTNLSILSNLLNDFTKGLYKLSIIDIESNLHKLNTLNDKKYIYLIAAHELLKEKIQKKEDDILLNILLEYIQDKIFEFKLNK